MREKQIHLAKGYSISAIDYASQGNAIIGIRKAGKTYGAMKVAEELLEADIPFLAFDPVGVWKNLKVGISGNKGYPVIVAGGPGSDIRLTQENAVSIVLAAMKAELSLIIDLFSPEFVNKSTWIKIVRESLEALMQNNSNYPLRHIFIEEASEFIPQKLAPGQQMVFSTIERIARIGRNFGLGFTLINQRSQEIAKSVFELCDFTLLFKQNGKNSLKAVKEWLDIREIKDHQKIISSLPMLEHGECWALGDTQEAHRIKILPRKTFHPSPEKNTSVTKTAKPTVNVSAFVEKLNKILQAEQNKKEVKTEGKTLKTTIASGKIPPTYQTDGLLSKLKQDYANSVATTNKLLSENADLRKRYIKAQQAVIKMLSVGKEIAEDKLPDDKPLKGIAAKTTPAKEITTVAPIYKPSSNGITAGSGAMRILKAALMYYPLSVTVQRAGTLAGISTKSGSWRTYIAQLKKDGYIHSANKEITATPEGRDKVGAFDPLPTDPDSLINFWMGQVGANSGSGRMLKALHEHYPSGLTKEALGEMTGVLCTSGSFRTYIAKLKSLGLIIKENDSYKVNKEFYS